MPVPSIGPRALWNRSTLDLWNDEVLAQIVDRGELTDCRELYRLVHAGTQLRARIRRLVLMTVPLPRSPFCLAALACLGDSVDFDAPVHAYYDATAI